MTYLKRVTFDKTVTTDFGTGRTFYAGRGSCKSLRLSDRQTLDGSVTSLDVWVYINNIEKFRFDIVESYSEDGPLNRLQAHITSLHYRYKCEHVYNWGGLSFSVDGLSEERAAEVLEEKRKHDTEQARREVVRRHVNALAEKLREQRKPRLSEEEVDVLIAMEPEKDDPTLWDHLDGSSEPSTWDHINDTIAPPVTPEPD